MKAVLIVIGDEILSGNTLDTNSNFIAKQFKDIGIEVSNILTISDSIADIKKALELAFSIGDIIITTGGLGPTKDDKTKTAFVEYFDDVLVFNEELFDGLGQYLEKRGRLEILDLNRSQAEVLSRAKILTNDFGTAPCQMIMHQGRLLFSLPGVPFEVKPLIKDKIIPYLQERFSLPYLVSRIVSVVGIPESVLANKISDWEDALPKDVHLSYLPVGNRVKLRLSSSGFQKEMVEAALERQISLLDPFIGEHIIAKSEDRIEVILSDILKENKLTISSSESCTGGTISKLITSVGGSSAYFEGGVVTYATKQKINLLKVSPELIEVHTVVSEEVAEAMALGCQKLFKTDIAVSTTGVAGPGKGEDQKEVGTVFYSIAIKDKVYNQHLRLPHLERVDFMDFVSQKVLQDVVSKILKP